MVKQRHICIEVCPISNQVLKLVTDMRNHPANYFVSQNLPIIISNDDPGFWIAKGVSYDFYYALMSLTPAFTGLSFVKQLALNSIMCVSGRIHYANSLNFMFVLDFQYLLLMNVIKL